VGRAFLGTSDPIMEIIFHDKQYQKKEAWFKNRRVGRSEKKKPSLSSLSIRTPFLVQLRITAF
jgi:hypothetical protein